MDTDALALEIVDLFNEFGKVRNFNDEWGQILKYSSMLYSVKSELGFFKELYYRCRISLSNYIKMSPEGKLIKTITREEMFKRWNSEAQKIAPHFKIIKEYEDDYEVRSVCGDFNYYLEAFTATRLKFNYLSFNKVGKIDEIIFSKIKETIPKDSVLEKSPFGGRISLPRKYFNILYR